MADPAMDVEMQDASHGESVATILDPGFRKVVNASKPIKFLNEKYQV